MGAEEKLADREHGVERGRILPVRVPVDLAEGQQPPDQVEGCRLHGFWSTPHGFYIALWLNPCGDAADQRVNEAICRMFTNASLDPAYGLGLPQKMAEWGFDILRSRATIHLCHGNAPIAKVMAESALVLRKEYTGTGVATDEDVDCYVAHARSPQYWSAYYSTISVLARIR